MGVNCGSVIKIMQQQTDALESVMLGEVSVFLGALQRLLMR